MAHGYLLSSLPLAADQPARRTSTAAARPRLRSRSRCSPPAARCGRREQADVGAHLRDRLGRGRLRRRRRGRVRAAAAARGLRHRRRLHRPGLARRSSPPTGARYQTPFADRIRHEAGIPVIAVGAISSYDDVNTIILAGRADLCALARPHLYDPHWTLHAAADQGVARRRGRRSTARARRPPQTGKDVRRMPLRRFDGGPGVSGAVVVTGGKRGSAWRSARASRRARTSSRSSSGGLRRHRRGRGRGACSAGIERRRAGQQRRRLEQRAAHRTTLEDWERADRRQCHRRVPVYARRAAGHARREHGRIVTVASVASHAARATRRPTRRPSTRSSASCARSRPRSRAPASPQRVCPAMCGPT